MPIKDDQSQHVALVIMSQVWRSSVLSVNGAVEGLWRMVDCDGIHLVEYL